jgi:hypothetical protein
MWERMQWRRRLARAKEIQTEDEVQRVAEAGGHPLSFLNDLINQQQEKKRVSATGGALRLRSG